jgi:hypothetical protein
MREVLSLIVLMVAFMSGILSIIREAISIFYPAQAAPATLFWRCVWIAFILSAGTAWYLEHQKAEALANDLDASKPRFSGEIHYAYPFKLADKSAVLLAATINNTGFKSVARGWRLRYQSKYITLDSVPYERIPNELTVSGDPSGKSFIVRASDSLAERAVSKPIEKGDTVTGWLLFFLPEAKTDEIIVKGNEFTVSFSDYLGVDKKIGCV